MIKHAFIKFLLYRKVFQYNVKETVFIHHIYDINKIYISNMCIHIIFVYYVIFESINIDKCNYITK